MKERSRTLEKTNWGGNEAYRDQTVAHLESVDVQMKFVSFVIGNGTRKSTSPKHAQQEHRLAKFALIENMQSHRKLMARRRHHSKSRYSCRFVEQTHNAKKNQRKSRDKETQKWQK